MIHQYQKHVQERAKYRLIPKPIDLLQITKLVKLLHDPSLNTYDIKYLLNLLIHRTLPGVNETSRIKVNFLTSIINDQIETKIISKITAIKILGTMQGDYNIPPLITLLDYATLAPFASQTSKYILLFDNFKNITQRAYNNNLHAINTLKSWTNGEWFFQQPEIKKKLLLPHLKSLEKLTQIIYLQQMMYGRVQIFHYMH